MERAEVLQDLYDIVKQNKESGYDRVLEEQNSYPYLYHLSAMRRNLLDFLPAEEGMRILELNAECGALTGSLLAKGARVDSVTETEKEASLIRTRYDAEQLQVYTKDGWQAAQAQKKSAYDMIVIAGSFFRYREKLGRLSELLKPEGKLYIADANRLGLKFFAGYQEEYQGGYFTGVNHYPQGGEKRCYTRKEYLEMLNAAGFAGTYFYYPYPDYRFPFCIYSEDRLPGRGELNAGDYNFDRDRIALFDEGVVADALLEEAVYESFANAFLIEASLKKQWMPRILYTKYSNERAGAFAIRTDIVQVHAEQAAQAKRIYKYAMTEEGMAHVKAQKTISEKLQEAYRGSSISICPCSLEETAAGVRAVFPYIEGKTLAEVLQAAADAGDKAGVEHILQEYIRRIRLYGGSVPFQETEEFCKIFGTHLPTAGKSCAKVSDIDLIFPNILVNESSSDEPENDSYQVIDYEWSFDFPIPKDFVIYRALYFAYYQILNDTDWRLADLLEMAEINEADAAVYHDMEEGFQAYLGRGVVPVRNMRRMLGTHVIPLEQLLSETNGTTNVRDKSGKSPVPEEEWLKVRKIRYHIDRLEYQDGSVICCGWALGQTRDGRSLPVTIQVTDTGGKEVPAEIARTKRKDVADALRIRRVTEPLWGFDCVWMASDKAGWRIRFSLGNREAVYETMHKSM